MISSKDSKNKVELDTPKTVIVALELPRLSADFLKFKQSKTAVEKIDFLRDSIINVYDMALSQFPNATQIMVVFREYTLTGQGVSKSISDKEKKYFKDVMQKLAVTNKKLVIIAGGTLIEKSASANELEKIREYYKSPDLDKVKLAEKEKGDGQINLHEQHLISTAKGKDHFTKIKNSSFVFFQSSIGRHGKIAPSFEHYSYDLTTYSDGKELSFGFQPGKGRNLSPIISLGKSSIGIEICREHYLGVLKAACEEKGILVNLQFILSDSIFICIENLCALQGTIHVDSVNTAQFIVTNVEQTQNKDIVFFHFNLLSQKPVLEGPIPPKYPLQIQIQNCIKEAKNSYNSNKAVLGKLRELENLLCFPKTIELSLDDCKQIILVALNPIYQNMDSNNTQSYHSKSQLLIDNDSKNILNATVIHIAHLLMTDTCTTGTQYRSLLNVFKKEFKNAYKEYLAEEEINQLPISEAKQLRKLDEELMKTITDQGTLAQVEDYLKKGANPYRRSSGDYSAILIILSLEDVIDQDYIDKIKMLFEKYQYTPKNFPDNVYPDQQKITPSF